MYKYKELLTCWSQLVQKKNIASYPNLVQFVIAQSDNTRFQFTHTVMNETWIRPRKLPQRIVRAEEKNTSAKA